MNVHVARTCCQQFILRRASARRRIYASSDAKRPWIFDLRCRFRLLSYDKVKEGERFKLRPSAIALLTQELPCTAKSAVPPDTIPPASGLSNVEPKAITAPSATWSSALTAISPSPPIRTISQRRNRQFRRLKFPAAAPRQVNSGFVITSRVAARNLLSTPWRQPTRRLPPSKAFSGVPRQETAMPKSPASPLCQKHNPTWKNRSVLALMSFTKNVDAKTVTTKKIGLPPSAKSSAPTPKKPPPKTQKTRCPTSPLFWEMWGTTAPTSVPSLRTLATAPARGHTHKRRPYRKNAAPKPRPFPPADSRQTSSNIPIFRC